MTTPPNANSITADEIKHLEFIQAVVTRLANGSFLIKGWTMTVAGAFFGIAANSLSWKISLTGLIPIMGFWLLDSYYLRQERLFRKLYDDVRNPATPIDAFSMKVNAYHAQVPWNEVVRSHTVVNFYGILFLIGVTFAIGGIVKATSG
ncbi:hypothetical protein [Streptomyces vinaceus]|uniref:hypothetical protein n=1 Tax=Streptomyces vinaceus TaxID=1960 RepID=UPI0036C3C5AC